MVVYAGASPSQAASRHNGAMSEVTNTIPSPVPSPCVSLCKMDSERRYCMGCLRTIPEIVAWGKADDDFKRAVWAELAQRRLTVHFDEEE